MRSCLGIVAALRAAMGIVIRQQPPASLGTGDESRQRKTGAPADGFLDSVAKLVPGEVLVGFVAALEAPGVGDDFTYHFAILVVFAALAPVVLFASSRRAGGRAHWLQYVVRTAAFVLVGVGGDPVLLDWLDGLRWIPSVGAAVIVILAAAILAPPAARDPLPP